MRALWKGSVAFGLVNVPIKMYAATEDHDVRFHQVHAEDGGRIRMKRECEVCGKQLSYSEIAKGYEDASGQRIIIEPEDLDGLPVASGRDIDVVEFVPSDQIDPILFDRTYYLEPEGRAAKPYVLLREALASTDRTALVKVAIRQRTQLACLRVRDGVLVLQTMKWPDEVREADFPFLDEEPAIRPQELKMAESLVETMTGDFEPGEYTDEYREAMLEMLDAKLSGGEGVVAPAPTESADTGQVVDLMAALRESVARSQAIKGAGADPSEEAEIPASPKAAPKKRAPRKTTSAGKGSSSGTASSDDGAGPDGADSDAQKTVADSDSESAAAKSTASKSTAAKTTAKPAVKKSTARKTAAPKATTPKSA